MRKAVTAGLAVLAVAAIVWASSDPWKKPYQQWDQKDITKIMQDSPWSKIVRVDAKWESSDLGLPQSSAPQGSPAGSESGGGGMAGRPGMGGGGAGPGGMQSASTGGGTPQAIFAVRWFSSKTVREAVVRSAVLAGQLKDSQAPAELAQPTPGYQIAVAGPQMNPFEKATEEELKNSAFLSLKKSKQKIQPEKVEFQKTPDGSTLRAVVFTFPEKTASGEPTIGPDEKGAEFSVSVGRTTIRTGFDFSKMDDAQGRDL
jgi:hypothetical protein